MLTPVLLGDLLVLSMLFLVVGHMFWKMSRREFFVFDPLNVFWAGCAVIYLQQPMANGDVYIGWYGESTFCWTLFWALFAFLLVIVGYESKLGKRLAGYVPHTPYHLDPSRFRLVAVGLVGLSLFGYALMIQSAGGLSAWASVGRGDTQAQNLPGWLYLFVNFQYLLPGAITILVFHVCMHRVSGFEKLLAWACAGMAMLWILYLGSRSRTVRLTMGLLAAVYLPKRRNPPVPLLAVLFLALAIIVPFLAAYRGQFTNFSFNLDRVEWNQVAHLVLPDFIMGDDPNAPEERVFRAEEFAVVMATIELVPNTYGFSYGYQMLELVTKPIPRRIWPDKRYPHFEAVTPIWDHYQISENWVEYATIPVLTGPAFSFVAYYWLIGGPVGIALGGFCVGAVFRGIRGIFDRNPGSEGDLMLYSVLLTTAFGEALSTPFLHLFYLVPQLAGVLALLWFARSRQPRLAPVSV